MVLTTTQSLWSLPFDVGDRNVLVIVDRFGEADGFLLEQRHCTLLWSTAFVAPERAACVQRVKGTGAAGGEDKEV